MSGVQANNDIEFTNTQSLTNATPIVWNTQLAPFEDEYEYSLFKDDITLIQESSYNEFFNSVDDVEDQQNYQSYVKSFEVS
jgi:hypothetical protein